MKVANLITGQVTYLQDESGAHLTLESVTALRPVPGSPNKARPAAEAPPAAARRRRRSDRDHNQSRPRQPCRPCSAAVISHNGCNTRGDEL